MNIKIIGLFLCISLSSFVNTSISDTVISSPAHSSPMIKVVINQKNDQELNVNFNIEKVFLASQKLTDKQLKTKILDFKKYMETHFKLYVNDQFKKMKLKSISDNRLRIAVNYKIKVPVEVDKLKLFSDCMAKMESHDRMPISINVKNIEKRFQLNNKRSEIEVVFQ